MSIFYHVDYGLLTEDCQNIIDDNRADVSVSSKNEKSFIGQFRTLMNLTRFQMDLQQHIGASEYSR